MDQSPGDNQSDRRRVIQFQGPQYVAPCLSEKVAPSSTLRRPRAKLLWTLIDLRDEDHLLDPPLRHSPHHRDTVDEVGVHGHGRRLEERGKAVDHLQKGGKVDVATLARLQKVTTHDRHLLDVEKIPIELIRQ